MALKFQFYDTYEVEEYYIYDPDFNTLEGWLRKAETLEQVPEMNGWISPRLGVRFELVEDQFWLYAPDNQPFVPASESKRQVREQRQRADELQQRADEQQRRTERLAAQLRALGIEPDV